MPGVPSGRTSELIHEVLFTTANTQMKELVGDQRLEGERLAIFSELVFLGRFLRFFDGYPYDQINVDGFINFFKKSFHEIIDFLNRQGHTELNVNENGFEEYVKHLSKYMKKPSTDNFWKIYDNRFLICEPNIYQSFDPYAISQLTELLLDPDLEIDSIPGSNDMFNFLNDRDIEIYRELYPEVFN